MPAVKHYKELLNKEYLGHWDLLEADKVVTIRKIVQLEVGFPKKLAPVVTLEGTKPLILNSTNMDTIARLYGTNPDEWVGKQVTLFASTTQLKGETVGCIRIRPAKPGPVKKTEISEERFDAALAQILAKKYTVEKLEAKHELTEAQRSRLPKLLEAGEVA